MKMGIFLIIGKYYLDKNTYGSYLLKSGKVQKPISALSIYGELNSLLNNLHTYPISRFLSKSGFPNSMLADSILLIICLHS